MIDFKVRRLNSIDPRPHFDCADEDLNEFFHKDSIDNSKQLLSVTYAVELGNELVAYFSISNDAIKRELCPRTAFERAASFIPHCKRYNALPAVKIGRLATAKGKQSNGIGSEILNFLKGWFTEGNKTGCRFIVVDAINKDRTINFYKKNGFKFLSQKDEGKDTRLLFFDLLTLKK